MAGNFFSQALRQAMKDHHFNQAQLADHLKVDPAYISRWLKGSSPRLDQLKAVLQTLGWAIERARPDYDAFSDAITSLDKNESNDRFVVGESEDKYANISEIKSLLASAAVSHKSSEILPTVKIGSVKGSNGTAKVEEKSTEYNSIDEFFPPVEYASKELKFLDVTDDSTDPMIQSGSRLMIREIHKPSAVPSGAMVILEILKDPGKLHVRRLVRLHDETAGRVDRLIGSPVAKNQDYIYFKPRDAKLLYVVVGVVAIPTL